MLKRWHCLTGLAALILVGLGVLHSQDTKPPYRGVLYRNWTKLGLTDKQTNDIYKVQGEHKAKIAELTKQIVQLKKQEKLAAIKVLTPAQVDRLKVVGSLEFRELLKEMESKKDDKPKPSEGS